MFISQSQLVEDFQELRRTLETMNMFSANLGFFFLHLAQILILEALAWVIVWHFGSDWLVTIFISCLLTVAQVSRYHKPGLLLHGKPQNFFFLFLLVSAAAWHFLASYPSVSDTSKLANHSGPQFCFL